MQLHVTFKGTGVSDTFPLAEDATLETLQQDVARAFGIPAKDTVLSDTGCEVDDVRQLQDGDRIDASLSLLSYQTGLKSGRLRLATQPPFVKADFACVAAAVSRAGTELRYAAPDFRSNPDIVRIAVSTSSSVVEMLEAEMRNNVEVMRAAVHHSGFTLVHAGPAPRDDFDTVATALQGCPHPILGQASEALRDRRDVVEVALHANEYNLEFASARLRNEPEVVLQMRRSANSWPAFNCISEELRGDRDFVLGCLAECPAVAAHISPALRDDEGVMCHASLAHASPRLRDDKAFVMSSLPAFPDGFSAAGELLRDDPEVVALAVGLRPHLIRHAGPGPRDMREVVLPIAHITGLFRFFGPGMQDDEEVATRALASDPKALRFASMRLRALPSVVLPVVLQAPGAVEDALGSARDNFDVAMAVVQRWGGGVAHLSPKLRDDPRVISAAMQLSTLDALEVAGPATRDSLEVMQRAVHLDGRLIRFGSDRLRNDPDLGLQAVRTWAMAFEHLGETLRNRSDVALHAVKRWTAALRVAGPDVQDNEAVVLVAVKRDGRMLRYASTRLQGTDSVVRAAVTRDGEALQYASAQHRDSRDIVRIAIRRDGRNIAYASDALRGGPLAGQGGGAA